MKQLSPIVLFVYNRPWHTKQTIEALQKNELANQSELIVYSDAPKNSSAQKSVDEVREYIKSIDGFKKVIIIERDTNWGLASSIIDGVTTVVNKHGRIIVLEDDLVTSPYFLQFMNDGLQRYENNEDVASIHGYVFPLASNANLPDTFFIRGADCWGWATWKRAWDVFDPNGEKLLKELMDKNLQKMADFNGSYGFTKMLENQIKGRNDSWAIRWYISAFLAEKLTLYPNFSFVHNIGFDGSGSHCGISNIFDAGQLRAMNNVVLNDYVKENVEARKQIEAYFKSIQASFVTKLVQKVKSILK